MPRPSTDTTVTPANPPCPHCPDPTRVVRNGHSRGKPRYKCKYCGVTFASDTAQHIAANTARRANFRLLASFPSTLRSIAALIGISATTAFRWRHEYIKELENKEAQQPPLFHRKVQITLSNVYNSYTSYPGKNPPIVRFLPSHRKQSHRTSSLVHIIGVNDSGRKQAICLLIDGLPNRANLNLVISKMLSIGSTAHTPLGDGTVITSRLAHGDHAQQLGVKWQPFRISAAQACISNPKLPPNQPTVEEARAHRARFMGWMRSFRGVSIDYLSGYVAWFNACNSRPQLAVRDVYQVQQS